jgi:hypothetical protein
MPTMIFHLFPQRLIEWLEEDETSIPASHCQIKQRQKKISVVVVANTIVEPNAMMIKLKDTSIAYRAMMTSWRTLNVTLVARCLYWTRKVFQGRVVRRRCGTTVAIVLSKKSFTMNVEYRIKTAAPSSGIFG